MSKASILVTVVILTNFPDYCKALFVNCRSSITRQLELPIIRINFPSRARVSEIEEEISSQVMTLMNDFPELRFGSMNKILGGVRGRSPVVIYCVRFKGWPANDRGESYTFMNLPIIGGVHIRSQEIVSHAINTLRREERRDKKKSRRSSSAPV